MSEHTPGPWMQHRAGSMRACDGRHQSDEGCRTIAEAEICAVPRAEAEANARLIAAAPDLLVAAKAALNDRMYKDWPGIADLLIAAIAKAEGR